MRKIIYTRPDGGVSVVHPARNTIGETLETEAEIEQRAWNKLPADAINPQFVDTVPADRTFRGAWKMSQDGISVDMPKAVEIHKEKLRQLRAPKLAALDVAYQRADEEGDAAKKAEIVAQKRELRDVTNHQSVLGAKSPEELKLAIPDALK